MANGLIARRSLVAGAATLLAAPAVLRAQSALVLRVGNQKGGLRSLASHSCAT